jgi:hypothetical protein
MAAQLYSNTQLAQALYEVLQELVADGKVPEELAVATLDQVESSLTCAPCDAVLSLPPQLHFLCCLSCAVSVYSAAAHAMSAALKPNSAKHTSCKAADTLSCSAAALPAVVLLCVSTARSGGLIRWLNRCCTHAQ